MHVLVKEPCEVPYLVISKQVGDDTHLGGRNHAEERLGETEAGIDLALQHRFANLLMEGSFKCSHLHSQLGSNRRHTKFHMTMKGHDDVVHGARGIREDRHELNLTRESERPDALDRLSLDSGQFFRYVVRHKAALKSPTQHSTGKERYIRQILARSLFACDGTSAVRKRPIALFGKVLNCVPGRHAWVCRPGCLHEDGLRFVLGARLRVAGSVSRSAMQSL